MPDERSAAMCSLLRPASLTVVGASDGGIAELTVENLRQGGYSGPIYPVHPRRAEAYGLPCYPSIAALPGPVDCAVVAVNRQNSVRVLEDLVEAGIQAAVVYASGFADGGTEGKALQQRLVEVAHAAGIAVCGPNCMGLVHVPSGARLTGYHLPPAMRPGHVAAIMQSGSVFFALAHNTRGLRFNYLISSGNEAVTDLCDHLEAVLADPQTRVVALFVEGIRHPERFLALVEQAHRQEVPVLVLKVGRSQTGARFAVAHTGALAGSDAVFTAVCQAHGLHRVHDIDELMDLAGAFATGMRLPSGPGVAAVTDSGGERTLLADLAEDIGVSFPPLAPATQQALAGVLPFPDSIANPLDAWGIGDARTAYPQCLRLLAEDPAIDVVALSTDAVDGSPEAGIYADSVIETARLTDKTVVLLSNVSSGQDEPGVARALAAGVPVLRGSVTGLRVITHLIAAGRRRQRAPSVPYVSPLAADELAQLRAELTARGRRGETMLDEYGAYAVLARYDIPIARHILVHSREEALAAGAALQAPLVLKICSARLQHKTDAGAVALGLRDAEEVGAAYERQAARFAQLDEGSGVPGLVQEMVAGGLETIVGLSRDPQWGLVLAFGLGGVLVEVLKDIQFALPPLDAESVDRLLSEIKAAPLLHGHRGTPPRDLQALRASMLGLSALAMDLGDLIEEVDINPLLALPAGEGALAVDALVRLRVP